MELMILVALIGLNGLLAMSETALVSSRRGRLACFADKGDRSAKVAMALNEEPQCFLSTIQIGITSIGIPSGIVGEAIWRNPSRSGCSNSVSPERPANGAPPASSW